METVEGIGVNLLSRAEDWPKKTNGVARRIEVLDQEINLLLLITKESKERSVVGGAPLGFYWRLEADSFLKCS